MEKRVVHLQPLQAANQPSSYLILGKPDTSILITLSNMLKFDTILCFNSNLVPAFSHEIHDYDLLVKRLETMQKVYYGKLLVIIENTPMVFVETIFSMLRPTFLMVTSAKYVGSSMFFDHILTNRVTKSDQITHQWNPKDFSRILKASKSYIDIHTLEYIKPKHESMNLPQHLENFINHLSSSNKSLGSKLP